jgi:pyruvate kinase
MGARSAATGRFELIATLGPASYDKATALAAAGATGFRLNASHLRPAELRSAVENLRRELPEARLTVDLQGAKMRLGWFRERPVRRDQVIIFSPEPEPRLSLPLPHPELFAAAGTGQTLTADDGKLRFRIIEATPTALVASSLSDGTIKPRKGINLMEHPVELREMTGPDLEHLASVEAPKSVTWAFSFMKDGTEAAWLRERVPGCRVVGKVERQEALDALGKIGSAVDEIWICRGDLGEQVGAASLARFVSAFDPKSLPCPVLMAGQVLEHLTAHPNPTRSEVCHLFDIVARGYAGIVLSDETACGADPENAVKQAAALLSAFGARG